MLIRNGDCAPMRLSLMTACCFANRSHRRMHATISLRENCAGACFRLGGLKPPHPYALLVRLPPSHSICDGILISAPLIWSRIYFSSPGGRLRKVCGRLRTVKADGSPLKCHLMSLRNSNETSESHCISGPSHGLDMGHTRNLVTFYNDTLLVDGHLSSNPWL